MAIAYRCSECHFQAARDNTHCPSCGSACSLSRIEVSEPLLPERPHDPRRTASVRQGDEDRAPTMNLRLERAMRSREGGEREEGVEKGEDGDGELPPALLAQSRALRAVLASYDVPVRLFRESEIQVGPTVVRYRIELDSGSKLAALQARAADIGRDLAARTTPMIGNVVGEARVYVDLEREDRESVALLPAVRELVSGEREPSSLPFLAGVSPSGEGVRLDLAQLPHLLVAGSTNSGKTVFLHGLLLSLLSTTPDLELLLVDPKATDFVAYEGLPQLRDGAVITEAEEAVRVLHEVTDLRLAERTKILRRAGAANRLEYNAGKAGKKKPLRPMVVVIDEYADLVAVLDKAGRESFERSIGRLAQRARSVGIHLVLATQRPTTDVITGGLKANMPARVSFRLPSGVDSRTILDRGGAECLLGRGDMLLLRDDGCSRLQAYYATPLEIRKTLSRLKRGVLGELPRKRRAS